ncbi:MAG: hypothetical protein IPM35_41555 [Myxococcales bacterium]|nr:hypothetical protein [Myxococcales bacterium]
MRAPPCNALPEVEFQRGEQLILGVQRVFSCHVCGLDRARFDDSQDFVRHLVVQSRATERDAPLLAVVPLATITLVARNIPAPAVRNTQLATAPAASHQSAKQRRTSLHDAVAKGTMLVRVAGKRRLDLLEKIPAHVGGMVIVEQD